jgi:non-heme chloroperoxidase
VDQRGHGASTLGSSACNTARLAADAVQVMDELDVRDALVVGHSLGGYVALAAAALHRDLVCRRVKALVLLGAPHTGRGLPEVSTLLSVAAPWTPRLQRSDTQGAVLMGLVAFGRSPARRDIDEVRYRWAGCAPATRRCFARALLGERLTPLLGRVEVPVVVARGTHDRIVTARRNRALVERLSHARTATFEGAGHALLCERPGEVAGVILDAAERPA